MTVFQVGDLVRIAHGAYNIADHRWSKTAKVTRIDAGSKLLPVRVEYDSFSFNWTNHESLVLVEAANTPEKTGAEILNRMVELKASIATRDAAVETVVEQTEALDALLASVGLKRGEEIPPIPVRVPAGPLTALDAVVAKTVEEGQRYRCTSDDVPYFSEGKVYTVESLDLRDNNQPIAVLDDDSDECYPDRSDLKHFARIV